MTGVRPGRVVFESHPDSSIGRPLADADLTIGNAFAWSVERYAEREALVYEGRRWTYEDLAHEVEQCARALIAAGAGKGTRVGLLMGTRPEFVIVTYAAAMVGAVTVLISTFSPDEELDWILRHSDTAILFMHAGVRDRDVIGSFSTRHPSLLTAAPGAITDPELPFLRRVVQVTGSEHDDDRVESWSTFLEAGVDVDAALVEARRAQVTPTDEALLLYTSGSTSHPKAVLHMQRSPTVQSFSMADCMAIGPEDRVWSTFPLFWTAGWVTAMGGPLLVGACMVFQEFFKPIEAGALLERERVTCVRQMIHDEHRLVAAEAQHPHDLSRVDVGVVTEALRERTGVTEPVAEICGWGMTETFAITTMLPFDAPIELRRDTTGRVIPGNEMRIRDQETGAEVPTGQLGEITVRGMSLMRGYYKAEPALPLDQAGFLATNDAGFFNDDGYLVFAGRLDGLIKTAGVNVSPIEIEERLNEWGRLGTVGIVGVPHPTLGAAIVLCAGQRDGEDVSEDEVKAYVRSKLASYKVPHEVVYIDEADFPLTDSGKVRAGELRPIAVERLLERDIDPEWREVLEKQRAS